jgi:hypothetical protein
VTGRRMLVLGGLTSFDDFTEHDGLQLVVR